MRTHTHAHIPFSLQRLDRGLFLGKVQGPSVKLLGKLSGSSTASRRSSAPCWRRQASGLRARTGGVYLIVPSPALVARESGAYWAHFSDFHTQAGRVGHIAVAWKPDTQPRVPGLTPFLQASMRLVQEKRRETTSLRTFSNSLQWNKLLTKYYNIRGERRINR